MSRATQLKPEAAGWPPPAPVSGELVCAPWQRMTGEEAAWEGLARSAAEPNPFFESWFLLPSLARLDGGRGGSILCFRQEGMLAGLMPIVRHHHYERWPLPHLGNWVHQNIFFGTPLVAPQAAVPFWRAVLDWADSNTGIAAFLHLSGIALDGPVYAALESVLAADGRAWGVVERKERALLTSGPDAGAGLEGSMPARKQKDLNRRLRRLAELGDVEFRWETGAGGAAQWIEEFLALEAAGWKGEAGSALACDPATEGLFRECLGVAAERERLVRLSLRLNDRPVAMLSTFLTPPGAFGFKTAFDEDYARFSPGVLLEREFLRAPRRFGISWCDSCAASDHKVMNRIWPGRRRLGRVSIAIGGPLRRAAFARILRKEIEGVNG